MFKLSSSNEAKSKSNVRNLSEKPPVKQSNRDAVNATDGGIVAHFGADSVKMIAESIGIPNIAEDAARMLADDITMRLKYVAQDAIKFAVHGRRTIVTSTDIDHALKNKNIPPMFGYHDNDLLPFRFASGGGRELYFQEEKEVELPEIIKDVSQAKLPQDVSIKCHWLSIEGVQPAIPENPPPLNKDRLRLEAIDPSTVLDLKDTPGNLFSSPSLNKFITQKKKKTTEVIKVKQYATHELSMEQQLYYKEITEACVGSDEARRAEALQSLTYDSGLHQMLPRLCTFISEGVKVNVVQNNLALLIYLMRMVKALLDNHNLYLEKYLHEIIPAMITCIVSKQLCLRPEHDNHWALRDFASRLLAQICRNFNTNTNNIQVRVTQLFTQSLDKERLAMSSIYGVISCLGELGPEVQRALLPKRLRSIGERVRLNLEGNGASSADKAASDHIRKTILSRLPAIIKNIRSPPDILEEYIADYGYFGPLLYNDVCNLRSQANPQGQARITVPETQNANTGNIAYRRVSNVTGSPVPSQPNPGKYTIIQQSTGSNPMYRISTAPVKSDNSMIGGQFNRQFVQQSPQQAQYTSQHPPGSTQPPTQQSHFSLNHHYQSN